MHPVGCAFGGQINCARWRRKCARLAAIRTMDEDFHRNGGTGASTIVGRKGCEPVVSNRRVVPGETIRDIGALAQLVGIGIERNIGHRPIEIFGDGVEHNAGRCRKRRIVGWLGEEREWRIVGTWSGQGGGLQSHISIGAERKSPFDRQCLPRRVRGIIDRINSINIGIKRAVNVIWLAAQSRFELASCR